MKTCHYRMSGFVLLCSILVFVSCSNVRQYEDELAEKNFQIVELQQQLDLTSASIAAGDSLLDEKIQKYDWLMKLNADTKWDQVVVRRFAGDAAEAKTITDPLFLANIGALLHLKSVGGADFPSGYQSDVDSYVYELHEQGQVYRVQVVRRGVIEAAADELYFEVDDSIHQLGVAFMPKPAYLKHDGLVSKMASSGAVKRGESYVQFAPFRVQSRVAPLAEGEQLIEAPAQAGERLETFTFYYYGQQLLMEVYADYAHLSGDGTEEWIGLQDAETILLGEAG